MLFCAIGHNNVITIKGWATSRSLRVPQMSTADFIALYSLTMFGASKSTRTVGHQTVRGEKAKLGKTRVTVSITCPFPPLKRGAVHPSKTTAASGFLLNLQRLRFLQTLMFLHKTCRIITVGIRKRNHLRAHTQIFICRRMTGWGKRTSIFMPKTSYKNMQSQVVRQSSGKKQTSTAKTRAAI